MGRIIVSERIKHVDQLSPDGYTRFFILCDILGEIYKNKKSTLKILDVGGGSEYMQQQLAKTGITYELTVLDIIERPLHMKATYIKGDATAMTFPDDSFDIVISTDVLEHVPGPKKQAFLDECLRVAGELCIIAAPFDTPGVNDAEITVNEFNKKLFGVGQDWLEEHLAFGKPKREMFLKTLQKKAIPFDEFGTQNIVTWLLNTQINLIDAKLGLPSTKHIAANQFYNQNVLEMNEFSGPTYRHFFVMYTKPSLKRFNTERYLSSKTDYAKIATYTNKLMTLHADRIAALRKAEKRLTDELYAIQQQQAQEKQHVVELQNIIDAQKQTLDRLEPFIKIARLPLVRKVHKTLGRGRN